MILKLQGYHSPWRDAVRRFTEKFLLKVPYLYFSSCKCWWIQLLCYHPRCNRFLPSHNPPAQRCTDSCNTTKTQPMGFYRRSRFWCPFGGQGNENIGCVRQLKSRIVPVWKKKHAVGLGRGNCCKSVVSIDSSIDSEVWMSFTVFSDATLVLSS